MRIRRIITGHDADGKAGIVIDEMSSDLVHVRPGATFCNVWSATLPADNDDPSDGAKQIVGTAMRGRSVFRVIEYGPGVAPRNHRTDSIDYGVVMSGEIVMHVDDQAVSLRAGDVFVQRGTIHNWVNPGDAPCVIAFVLIDANPVTLADGRPLPATG